MMDLLKKILENQGYSAVRLLPTKTLHWGLKVSINGVAGRFLLDTGASNTCLGLDKIAHFKLQTISSEIKVMGVGVSLLDVQVSLKNTLQIGKWKRKNISLSLFDLSHINHALTQLGVLPIDGVIGADILKKGKAIIDYSGKKLFLK